SDVSNPTRRALGRLGFLSLVAGTVGGRIGGAIAYDTKHPNAPHVVIEDEDVYKRAIAQVEALNAKRKLTPRESIEAFLISYQELQKEDEAARSDPERREEWIKGPDDWRMAGSLVGAGLGVLEAKRFARQIRKEEAAQDQQKDSTDLQ